MNGGVASSSSAGRLALRKPTASGKDVLESATAGPSTAAPASKPPHMEYWSLGVFSPTNPIRRAAQRLVSSSKFESLILLCIFVNCLFLAMAEPAVAPDYSSDPTMDALLRGADYVFTCIFGVEMVCKLVALGLACHAGAYLRSPWNWLDGTVVLFSILGLIPATQELVNGVGALRTIRLLRPLRTVNRIESMRTTVKALITATPRLIHVGLLCACCFFVFGIVGVQLFSGVLRNRCHTQQGGELVLLEAATPCGGGNQCLRERQRLSGLVEPPAMMTFESTAACSTLNVSSWEEGDVYCCEPTLPPHDSLAYWNSQAGWAASRCALAACSLLAPCHPHATHLPPIHMPPACHLLATCLPPACHLLATDVPPTPTDCRPTGTRSTRCARATRTSASSPSTTCPSPSCSSSRRSRSRGGPTS